MGENSESGAERSGAVGAGAGAGAGVDLARERGERIWRRFAPERARERLLGSGWRRLTSVALMARSHRVL
jgi:hypothetical protein